MFMKSWKYIREGVPLNSPKKKEFEEQLRTLVGKAMKRMSCLSVCVCVCV